MAEVRRMMRDGECDVLLAFALDRVSRSQNHIGVLFDEAETNGVRLDFATEDFEDTAIGKFIVAARALIAEVEREKIAERTMRGKEERARNGRLAQGDRRRVLWVHLRPGDRTPCAEPPAGSRGPAYFQGIRLRQGR